MRKKGYLIISYVLAVFGLNAQTSIYPQGYFRNPMNIPMELSANFGELRPDHWHMGLDIRTNAKENLPVHAAANGYISHVGIRPKSFGRFIIINHPNGLSTLYAHLNDFYPELEEHVKEQQDKNESWAIELEFQEKQFPVKKGDFIAYSGNTGGSQGPHLHFEIIDTKSDKRLNPLLFGFPFSDKTPPTLVRLAMYDRSRSVYEQTPVLFHLKNTDSGYIIPKIPFIRTGLNKVSFALEMYDKTSSSSSPNGVYAARLYFNDVPQLGFDIDSVNYEETVYMNAHIDYKHDYNGGVYLQHLSKMPGDKGRIYKEIEGEGVYNLTDTAVHVVTVKVWDAHNNTSYLQFSIRYDDSLARVQSYLNTNNRFAPNKKNVISKPDFEIVFPEKCFYDTVAPAYYSFGSSASNALSLLHQVGDASVPLHQDAIVKIKLNKEVPFGWKEKLLVLRTDKKGRTIKKATLDNDWVSAKFNDFGSFQVFADLTPPTLMELGKGDTINLSASSAIVFTPTDNFGVKKFRAELDSQWIRFTNDKGRNWIYKFDDRCPYGVHNLKVTVEDLVGNTTTKTWWFKRYPYTPPKKKVIKKGSTKKKNTQKKSPTTKKLTVKKKK